MRNDLVTVASGWVSDCAIADLVGDDPTDALVPTRAPTPELALVGALLAVAIGDLQRADPDARAWVEGNEPDRVRLSASSSSPRCSASKSRACARGSCARRISGRRRGGIRSAIRAGVAQHRHAPAAPSPHLRRTLPRHAVASCRVVATFAVDFDADFDAGR
jgi:hypothetical protein